MRMGGTSSSEMPSLPLITPGPLQGGVLTVDGTEFTALNNTYGARWELSGLPVTPLDLRITGDNGQTLIARHAINQVGFQWVSGRDGVGVGVALHAPPAFDDIRAWRPAVWLRRSSVAVSPQCMPLVRFHHAGWRHWPLCHCSAVQVGPGCLMMCVWPSSAFLSGPLLPRRASALLPCLFCGLHTLLSSEPPPIHLCPPWPLPPHYAMAPPPTPLWLQHIWDPGRDG